MTLIVGAIFRGCLFQASDRLTTTQPDVKEWDPEANKVIIARAGESLIVSGYSGTAYLDGFPTDTWLAGAISGLPSTGPRTLESGSPQLDRGPHDVAQRVADALQAYALRVPHAVSQGLWVELQMLYMHRVSPSRRRPRAGAFYLLCDGRKVSLRHEPAPDGWWANAPQQPRTPFVTVGPSRSYPGVEALARERLRAIASSAGPGDFAPAMAATVREASAITPSIGSDVMTVSLFPFQDRAFIIDYSSQAAGSDGGLGYTPWFVTPNGVMAPMQATPMEMGIGGGEPFHMRVLGPEAPGGLIFGVKTQPRKQPPR